VFSILAVRRTQLSREANRVAGAVRFAYDRARATGRDHRIVFELDDKETRFWIEVAEEGHVLIGRDPTENARMREAELERLEEREKEARRRSRRRGGRDSGGETSATSFGADEEEPDLKRAPKPKWKRYESHLAKKMKLERGWIESIYLARYDEAIRDGRIYMYFWGNGQTEKAVIHVSDGSKRAYSLVSHPLTGRVKIREGRYEMTTVEAFTDDEGVDIQER
jgi:general secretion pathway protein H